MVTGTLVTPLATDARGSVAESHRMQLLEAETGRTLSPPLTSESEPGTGRFTFTGVPNQPFLVFHVSGKGPADAGSSTYDSLSFLAPRSLDSLVRVGDVASSSVYAAAGGFVPRADRAPLSGVVYSVNDKAQRIGVVGCAQVLLDEEPHPALQADQRYLAADGLPAPFEKLSRTLSSSGGFYFGNVTKGFHTLRVRMNDGGAILLEHTFYLPFTRAEATSEYKELLQNIGLDLPGPNPTPADCLES